MDPIQKVSASQIDLSATSGVERRGFIRECVINIENGLHARPSVMLMKLSSHFFSAENGESAEFRVGDQTVNPAHGILSMLGLVAGKDSVLVAKALGVEAERANAFFDAVAAVVSHPFPEHAIYESDATEKFGFAPGIAEVLRQSIDNKRHL